MRVLVLGGTELTLAVCERLMAEQVALVGLVHLAPSLDVSFDPRALVVARHAELGVWAATAGIAARQFADADDIVALQNEVEADVCLVAGWYHLVPARVRDRFAHGCIGFHASLLPELRGHAPLNWAILQGRSQTGVTAFRLTDAVDEGMIFGQSVIQMGPRSTIGELADAAARAAADLAVSVVRGIAAGTEEGREQVGVPSYGLRRVPDDGWIDWHRPADDIDRLIRAVSHPYPGALTMLEGEELLIWAAEPVGGPVVFGVPGQLFSPPDGRNPVVVTGDGLLRVDEVTDRSGADRLGLLRRRSQWRLRRDRP